MPVKFYNVGLCEDAKSSCFTTTFFVRRRLSPEKKRGLLLKKLPTHEKPGENMRIAILSDIHGNLEALDAVIRNIGHRRVDVIVSLGDMIGYGPDPDAVVQQVRDLQCYALLGNHEASLIGEGARRWMNFQAQENNILTEALLSPENLTYCRRLPRSLRLGGLMFVHGYPPDSVFAYLFNQSDRKIAELFASSPGVIFFIGHTHDLQLIQGDGLNIIREPLAEGRIHLVGERSYIVNAGSVGQPRDGDNRAKYLVWDDSTGELEVLFVPYDFTATARKIRERGFPDVYAERLR